MSVCTDTFHLGRQDISGSNPCKAQTFAAVNIGDQSTLTTIDTLGKKANSNILIRYWVKFGYQILSAGNLETVLYTTSYKAWPHSSFIDAGGLKLIKREYRMSKNPDTLMGQAWREGTAISHCVTHKKLVLWTKHKAVC